MAVHILKQNHDVARLGHLRVWAEHGLIKIEDARDNSYKSLSVREALLHIKGLNDMKPGIDGTEDAQTKAWVYETRQEIQRFVDQVLDVVEKARAQGMPDDPSAKHSLRAARKTTVLMPTECTLDF